MTETVKVEGGHWQETEETVNKWWVVTGRRQRRQ